MISSRTDLSFFLAVLLWGVAGATALAHDTWLVPEHFSIGDANVSLALDLTSGESFPTMETSIKPERIAVADIRVADRTENLQDFQPAATSLRCTTRTVNTGVATLWVKLKPKTLELTPTLVEEYLREIDAPGAVRERWEKRSEPRRWKESYTKHAKTFVRVGEAPADRSWLEPVGLGLEIVPENDPTAIRRGDTFSVRVLDNRRPMPDFALGIVGGNPASSEMHRTDANGRATFRLNQSGRWLLRGTNLRISAQPDLDWESDFTTLTIEVQEK